MDSEISLALLIGFVGGVLVGFAFGVPAGVQSMEARAVKNGAGYYQIVEAETGKTEFRWGAAR